MGSQLQAFKPTSHCNMKPLIILGLVALSRSQYSGETQDLSNSQLDALKDIFGDAAGGGAYSGQQVGRLEGGTNGVEAIIQVVKNEDGYVAPDDYQHWQEEGSCTGQGVQGTGDPQQVQPVQRLLAAHRCCPSHHRRQRICRWWRRRHFWFRASWTECCSTIRLVCCQIDTRVIILVPFCHFVHSGNTIY